MQESIYTVVEVNRLFADQQAPFQVVDFRPEGLRLDKSASYFEENAAWTLEVVSNLSKPESQ